STTAQACGARGAGLTFAQSEGAEIVHFFFDSQRQPALERMVTRARDGLLGSVMQKGEQLLYGVADLVDSMSTLQTEQGKLAVQPWGGNFPFELGSVCAVPLEGESGTMGAIGVFAKADEPDLSEPERSLLQAIAANVSTALRLFLANEERERTARLTSIGRLLSQVIHDFKTPLTVISGYVQLMQNADDRDLRVEYAQKALRQFDVLTGMQREVLEFARGEKTIFVRRVYLHKFFGEFRQLLSQQVDGRAIDLELDIDNKVVA